MSRAYPAPGMQTLERKSKLQVRHRRAVIEQWRRDHIRKQIAAAAQRRAAALEHQAKPS